MSTDVEDAHSVRQPLSRRSLRSRIPSTRAGAGIVAPRLGAFLLVAVVGLIVVAPIVILLILSFGTATKLGQGQFTFANYAKVLGDHQTWHALKETAIFTAGSSVIAAVLGTTMAWAIASVRTRLAPVLRLMPLCALILPPLVKDPAWVILFSPRTGLVNLTLHAVLPVSSSTFNVFSMVGMISVQGIFAAPLVYIVMLAPLEALDRSYVEASAMSGARGLRTLARVVLPMTLPALLSAITLAVIIIASGFETPILIGLPAGVSTYISLLYETVSSPTVQLNFAASQGCIYLLLTLALMTCYLTATRNERKFVTITGRGNQAIQLARPLVRRLLIAVVVVYFFVAFVTPLCITLLTSFLHFYSAVNGNPFHNFTLSNYRQVFGAPTLVSAVETSTLLAVLACAIVVFVALVFAIIAWKTHGRLRRACEAIAMAPIAVPALVYSIALFLTVLALPGLSQHLYGSKFVMLVAEAIVFLPLAMRLMAGAVIQVSDDLIDAARSSGATFFRSMCSIVVPIVRPALLYTASVVIVLSYRELAAIVFLVATNTTVVPYASFTAWVSGGYPLLSALNVITMLIPIVLVALVLGCARGSRLSRLAGSRTVRVRRESTAVSR